MRDRGYGLAMDQNLKVLSGNKKSKILLLLLLPVLLLSISVFFKTSKGEFYIGRYYDPSYAYLINSLNIVNGQSIGHFDHPGTPVQLIGAATLYFQSSGTEQREFIKSVFTDPERFLLIINICFILMVCVSLFITGLMVFNKTGNIIAALLIQLTPFTSTTILYNLTNVSPEPLIIFSMLIFLAITCSMIYEKDLTGKKLFKYVYLFGSISGFLLSVKISAFPVMLIPLILIRGFRMKSIYILITLLIFFIIISITMSYDNVMALFTFLKRITLRSGAYGFGSQEMLADSFLSNLKKIIYYEPFFIISYLTSACIMIYTLISKKFKTVNSNMFKLLLGIVVMMTLQLIIVSKHFQIYYMLPALMLSVPALIVGIGIMSSLSEKTFFKKAAVIIFMILFFLPLKTLYSEISSYRNRKAEAHKIINYVEQNFSDSVMVFSNTSSGKIPALFMGIQHSGKSKEKYVSIMNELYPGKLSFDIWLKNIDPKSRMTDDFTSYNNFIIQCSSNEVLSDFINLLKQNFGKKNLSFTKLFSNNRDEGVYRISCD